MSFAKNLSVIETEFAPAMDMVAGKGIKVRTIFVALRKLEKGEYSTIGEMCKKMGFNQQNTTYLAIAELLKSMGTPPAELSSGKGKVKLDGNAFAMELLKKKGLELPKKKA